MIKVHKLRLVMEKIKKFVKKNQILLIAVCVCIAALTVAFFAGGNRSENKVQTASTEIGRAHV